MSPRALAVLVATLGAGLFLLVAPSLYNTWFLQPEPQHTYSAPEANRPAVAATPIPTTTPYTRVQALTAAADEIRPGPVVIDFGHLNQINASNFQALAGALARRGLATRLWITGVDPASVENFTDFPDQSKELAEQLRDASALIVVSPFFLWTPQEIAVAERFVADGGRLLLISDPDVFGDTAVIMNLLAEPFGVVFNDDYLYDTEQNDENFTHFFNTEFAGEAAELEGARVAFYGGRSVGGDVTALARSAPTTLSSMVTGVSGFTTAALGGVEGRGTAGRVLALSDFDVFSEPNAVRHDNRRFVEFVAEFLAGAQRTNSIADFPQYLGRDVYLLFGSQQALDAETLLVGARLQRRLEETGRTLTLTGQEALTRTLGLSETLPVTPTPHSVISDLRSHAAGAATATATATATTVPSAQAPVTATQPAPLEDLIYLARYDVAEESVGLLTSLGITLVTELITPTVTPASLTTPTPTPTPAPPALTPGATATPAPGNPTPLPRTQGTPAATPTPGLTPALTSTATLSATPEAGDLLTPTLTVTATGAMTGPTLPNLSFPVSPTAALTGTVAATPTATATPTPHPTPVEVTFLVTDDGLRLLASETSLVLQQQLPDGHRFVAALGFDVRGIDSAVERLLANDFSACIIGAEMTWCPVQEGGTPTTPSGATPTPAATSAAAPGATTTPATPGPGGARAGILLVDDNALAAEGEASEADRWLQALTAAGHQPELWSTSGAGRPDADKLKQYDWVIWSNGGYAQSQLDINYLDPIFSYLNDGGRFTVSSLMPFFGMGVDPASPARDVVTDDDLPPLVEGLPSGPVALEDGGGLVAPLTEPTGSDSFEVALRRGPASDDADAPIFIAASDAGSSEATGARLSVLGMSLAWLPREVGDQVVENLATWMLAD